MANADGYVLPTPGLPKTLGILSVIFGVLLFLFGLCTLASLVVAPAMIEVGEQQIKQVQAKVQAQRKSQIQELEEREKAATKEEERDAIKKEREELIASPGAVPTMDMSAATAVLKDPVIMGFSYIQMGSGAILSLLLLISGIGLIRLTPWGRTMSIAWAAIQIIQLLTLTAASLFYVQPLQAASNEKMLAKMEADAKAPNAPPGLAETARMTRAMSNPAVARASSVIVMFVFMIYPVVILILLNKPGAKAALLGSKPSSPAEF